MRKNTPIFRAFFGCFFFSHTNSKWCVCTRFPQPSNIRATWNLESKLTLDQREKLWRLFFKIRILPFLRQILDFLSFFRFLMLSLSYISHLWPRNLIFGLNDVWDMRKKHIFLFFEILKNDHFRAIFRGFFFITSVFVKRHIIRITVFCSFDWHQLAYHFSLKWLMLIDIFFFIG